MDKNLKTLVERRQAQIEADIKMAYDANKEQVIPKHEKDCPEGHVSFGEATCDCYEKFWFTTGAKYVLVRIKRPFVYRTKD